MYTPSTHLTRTPEKAINSSPFKGSSQSEKYKFNQYPPVQHQINNYYNERRNISTTQFDPIISVDNLIDNTRVIQQKCDDFKTKWLREYQLRQDIEQSNQQYKLKIQDQQDILQRLENECQKKDQVAKQLEVMVQSLDEKQNENNIIITKQQRVIKQQEQDIVDLKLKLKKEQELRESDSVRSIQQFKIIHEETLLQNDKLMQENEILKQTVYKISNRSSLNNGQEQNFQTNTDFLDEQELKAVVQEYLMDYNEYAILQIPDKQLLPAIQLIKSLFQQVNKPTLEKIDLKELKAKRNYILQEMKSKMNLIGKAQLDKFNQIEFQNEMEQLKKELQKVEQLIQQFQQAQLFNPGRNSWVSFEDQEIQ